MKKDVSKKTETKVREYFEKLKNDTQSDSKSAKHNSK